MSPMSPMQRMMTPDDLTRIITNPMAKPQERMAAVAMLNQMRQGAGVAERAPQGDGTGASDMDPSFIRAVQQEMQGEQSPQGLPEQQAAPQEADGVTSDIMRGAADADRVATMYKAAGGAVRGYQEGGPIFKVPQARLEGGMENYIPESQRALENEPPPRPPSKWSAILEKLSGEDDSEISAKDKWLALAQAGFGMAKGASQPGATFMGSLGAGGSEGISGLREMQALRAQQRMKNMQIAQYGLTEEHRDEDQIADRAQRRESKRLDNERMERQYVREAQTDKDALELKTLLGGQANALAQERQRLAEEQAPKGVPEADPGVARLAGVPVNHGPFKGQSLRNQEKMAAESNKQYERDIAKNREHVEQRNKLITSLDRYDALNETTTTGPVMDWMPGTVAFSAARQEMESITASISPTLRTLGVGASSDYDAKELKLSAPSVALDNIVSTNRIAAIRSVIELEKEHDEFVDNYFSVNRHTSTAEAEWKKYVNANPILDPAKPGQLQPNPNRKSYKEYFGGDREVSVSF